VSRGSFESLFFFFGSSGFAGVFPHFTRIFSLFRPISSPCLLPLMTHSVDSSIISPPPSEFFFHLTHLVAGAIKPPFPPTFLLNFPLPLAFPFCSTLEPDLFSPKFSRSPQEAIFFFYVFRGLFFPPPLDTGLHTTPPGVDHPFFFLMRFFGTSVICLSTRNLGGVFIFVPFFFHLPSITLF